MQIIAIANQKGGTAKSTTAAALAQGAAYREKKTLAIDLDPQGNLTFFLKANPAGLTALDVLEGQPAADAIQQTEQPNLYTIAANWNLQAIRTGTGSARRLASALEPIKKNYDLIIIDTPPTAGELQLNALMAASDLIIPVQADRISLEGLYQMIDTAQAVQRANKGLNLTGYVLTRCRGRSTLSRQMAEAIKQRAAEYGIPFLAAIREAVALQEAQALQESLYQYAPKCNPAQDYLILLDKLTGTRKA